MHFIFFRLQEIVASMSRLPTFRRRFKNLIKVLYIEALEPGASAIQIGGTVVPKHREKSKEHNVDEGTNRCWTHHIIYEDGCLFKYAYHNHILKIKASYKLTRAMQSLFFIVNFISFLWPFFYIFLPKERNAHDHESLKVQSYMLFRISQCVWFGCTILDQGDFI